MEEKQAIAALSALAQAHRLKVFRLLVQQAPHGLPAGRLAEYVGVPASTMSAHLAQLERAGLLRSWRQQRWIYYAADLAGIRALLTFLTQECCQGRPELCGYDSLVPFPGMEPQDLEALERTATMADRVYHVLFLCTGNSARSIMAESILNQLGQGRFKAYSAGSRPQGAVHPLALQTLQNYRYPTAELRSKGWDEFTRPGAPAFDFVFTLCDDAAQEACPVWPGQPVTAHWGMPDPAAVPDAERTQSLAFLETLRMLTQRLEILVALPIDSLDQGVLHERLKTIDTTVQKEDEDHGDRFTHGCRSQGPGVL